MREYGKIGYQYSILEEDALDEVKYLKWLAEEEEEERVRQLKVAGDLANETERGKVYDSLAPSRDEDVPNFNSDNPDWKWGEKSNKWVYCRWDPRPSWWPTTQIEVKDV